jgi:hypothetical protein
MTQYQIPIDLAVGATAGNVATVNILRTGTVQLIQFVLSGSVAVGTGVLGAAYLELARQGVETSSITGPVTNLLMASPVCSVSANATDMIAIQNVGVAYPVNEKVNLGDILFVNQIKVGANISLTGHINIWVMD